MNSVGDDQRFDSYFLFRRRQPTADPSRESFLSPTLILNPDEESRRESDSFAATRQPPRGLTCYEDTVIRYSSPTIYKPDLRSVLVESTLIRWLDNDSDDDNLDDDGQYRV